MTQRSSVAELVAEGEGRLRTVGVEQGRLEAELLLAQAMGTPRLELHLRWRRQPAEGTAQRYRSFLAERESGKPLQYIAGRTDFRELELEVDDRVLIPRPETEGLVDLVLAKYREGAVPPGPWADVGTGSGAIALSLAVEEPTITVIGIEVSQPALAVARRNHARAVCRGFGSKSAHGARVTGTVIWVRGSLLGAFAPSSLAAVVSNPPYVSSDQWSNLPPEVRDFEPPTALHGGLSGLEVALRLTRQAAHVLRPGGMLAMELGDGQASVLSDALRKRRWFADADIRCDLSGRQRYFVAMKER